MTEPTQKNKLEHKCFPQPADGSVRTWRYLDLAKFIWLLDNQRLYLASLDSLSDPHEGSTPRVQATYEDQRLLAMHRYQLVREFGDDLGTKKFQAAMPLFIEQNRQMRIKNQKERRQLYVNCWYLGDLESEAMWRLYCPDNNGVAIQTSYSKLVESVANDSELYIGRVTYIDYDAQVIPSGNLFYPVMHKRISFAHEQEVRLVKIRVPDNWGLPHEFCPPGIPVDWPLEPTVDAIYVDPYAPEYFYDVVRSVVRRIAPDLEDRVLWSPMKASPVF